MKKALLFSYVFLLTIFAHAQADTSSAQKYALVIHGGAGNITPDNISEEKEDAYFLALNKALLIGDSILKNNGTAMDAVEYVIRYMEDCPLYNAGKGAVFTSEGTIELDASVMDEKTLNAGAVAGVKKVKNPISAARLVMEKTPHVFLIGSGADKFAADEGLDIVDSSYFYTEERWKQYKGKSSPENKKGTVGAVALDVNGNLAAGTSTGGMSNKKYGRVGDSPVIGAGTYANNLTCAVSCTGHGEYFIRNVVAYDVSAIMQYAKLSLQEAAETIILDKLKKQGAEGGLIGIDNKGNYVMIFNTAGMFRGYINSEGHKEVMLYGSN